MGAFRNLNALTCQAVAKKKLKTIQNLKTFCLQKWSRSLRKWSLTRGSNCKVLCGNILSLSHGEVRLYRLLTILLAIYFYDGV